MSNTVFPGAIDVFTLLDATSTMVDHYQRHNKEDDAILALEAKVGIDGSAVTTSLDFKLSGVTGGDKAVSRTGTETLTNKTLTAPIISSIVNTGTLTLPTATTTLVGRTTTDTLTNKTLTSPVLNTPTFSAGAIGTADLAANAITQAILYNTSRNAFTSGTPIFTQAATSNTWYQVTALDTVITTTGGRVEIDCMIMKTSGSASDFLMKVERGSTFVQNSWSLSGTGGTQHVLTATDTPAAGTYTYKFWVALSGVTATVSVFDQTSLRVVEVKK